MVREPVVAGEFYEDSFERLTRQIEECYCSKSGPGDLPEKRTETKIRAIISPHAGYFFSGPCAAWAYSEIAISRLPQVFLLLGPNHYTYHSYFTQEDFRTPFGLVRTDPDAVKELSRLTGIKINHKNHDREHSLEVQLPFLQHACKDQLPKLKIIPLIIGHGTDYDSLGKHLHEFFKDKDVTIIVSSDFTHYGMNYRYLPFTTNIHENIDRLDNGAIELIRNLDTKGFSEYVERTGITICGYAPILTLMSMLSKGNDKPKATVLMHYMSGDIMSDYRNSVSYVAMSFK